MFLVLFNDSFSSNVQSAHGWIYFLVFLRRSLSCIGYMELMNV
jgi:hypothetical protein